MNRSQHLAWIDLEMTGLDSTKDVILEIASLVTDADLNIIAEGPDLIIRQSSATLNMMNDTVTQMHTSSGLIDLITESKTDLALAEQQTLDFFAQYEVAGTMPLCGNSIWQDKMFLVRYMPKLINFFHYRIIDVSTIKELVCRWHNDPEFKKAKGHRALADIKESVAELKFYKEKFFVKT
jgi:oligoribonuclease